MTSLVREENEKVNKVKKDFTEASQEYLDNKEKSKLKEMLKNSIIWKVIYMCHLSINIFSFALHKY